MTTNDLDQLCKQTLVDGLRPSLKADIDRLLQRGASKVGVLSFVRASIERQFPGEQRGQLTLAAVEAYLEGKP